VGCLGQAAVEVDSKVADGVSWEDFCIAKGKGTAVKQVTTPESAWYTIRIQTLMDLV